MSCLFRWKLLIFGSKDVITWIIMILILGHYGATSESLWIISKAKIKMKAWKIVPFIRYRPPVLLSPCRPPGGENHLQINKYRVQSHLEQVLYNLSHVMRKPVSAICEQQRCKSACAFSWRGSFDVLNYSTRSTLLDIYVCAPMFERLSLHQCLCDILTTLTIHSIYTSILPKTTTAKHY